MSKLVKDIVESYLKEDLQRVLQKTSELKEMSAFSREFAQQMRQKGEGGVYRSKVTGQNIRLQYATPKTQTQTQTTAKTSAPLSPARTSAPAPKPQTTSPGQVTLPPISRNAAPKPAAPPADTPPVPTASRPGLSTGKQTLPSVNIGKPKAEPEMKGRMIPPSESGIDNKSTTPDYSFVGSKKEMRQGAPMPPPGSPVNAPAVSGVRDFGANPPSSLAQTPKAPEPSKDDTSSVSSALADRIKPSQLASNPENLVNKDVLKGRESKPMNESVVSVGSNKYRIV